MNPALILGLSSPTALALSGGDLFVANDDTGTIGEYTTSGATVDPALISGLAPTTWDRGVWVQSVGHGLKL